MTGRDLGTSDGAILRQGMYMIFFLARYIVTGCIFCAPSALRQGQVFDPQRHPPPSTWKSSAPPPPPGLILISSARDERDCECMWCAEILNETRRNGSDYNHHDESQRRLGSVFNIHFLILVCIRLWWNHRHWTHWNRVIYIGIVYVTLCYETGFQTKHGWFSSCDTLVWRQRFLLFLFFFIYFLFFIAAALAGWIQPLISFKMSLIRIPIVAVAFLRNLGIS